MWIERSEFADLPEDEKADLRATVGIAPPGVEVRIVDADTREELPWDDEASGELECRGPWVAKQYYRTDEPGEQFSAGRLAAHRRRRGDLRRSATSAWSTARRTWSSPAASGSARSTLENQIMAPPEGRRGRGHRGAAPEVVRATAGLRRRQGRRGAQTSEEMLDFLRRAAVDKWQVPDDVVFIDEVPKTSVGKFSKKTLRDRFADYVLPNAT